MNAIYILIFAQVVTLAYMIRGILRSNRRNGLFMMTALQVYLMKYHGMNAEEAEGEYVNYIKCEREILDEIKQFCPTEDYGRGEVVKYRRNHKLNS